jgi:hypothetical protein
MRARKASLDFFAPSKCGKYRVPTVQTSPLPRELPRILTTARGRTPEMRLLPDMVYRCPTCGSEVVPVAGGGRGSQGARYGARRRDLGPGAPPTGRRGCSPCGNSQRRKSSPGRPPFSTPSHPATVAPRSEKPRRTPRSLGSPPPASRSGTRSRVWSVPE